MGIGEADVGALQDADRFLLPQGHLAIDDHRILVLDGEVEFLDLFIHCDAVGPVRCVQRPVGVDVSSRAARKDRQRIERVVVDGINVAGFRINVETAVELCFGLVPANDPLRFRQSRRGRRIGHPVIDHNLKKVLVLEDDFVVGHVHSHGTVCRKRIADCPERRSFQC